MGKTKRDLAILGAVEGGILLACWVIPKVVAKPVPPALKGEAIIQGKVTESIHLLPIPYATIKFNGLSCHADENGEYQIVEIPLGKFNLTISADGYHSRTISVTIKQPTTYTRDVELEPIALPLAYVEQI